MQREGEPTRDPDHRSGRPSGWAQAWTDRGSERCCGSRPPSGLPRSQEEAAFIDRLRTARAIS